MIIHSILEQIDESEMDVASVLYDFAYHNKPRQAWKNVIQGWYCDTMVSKYENNQKLFRSVPLKQSWCNELPGHFNVYHHHARK